MERSHQALCVVKLIQSKDCFVTLPRRHHQDVTLRVSDVSIVKMCPTSSPDTLYYCSVTSTTSQEEDVVLASPSLGIQVNTIIPSS